jgi:hypothetical protein
LKVFATLASARRAVALVGDELDAPLAIETLEDTPEVFVGQPALLHVDEYERLLARQSLAPAVVNLRLTHPAAQRLRRDPELASDITERPLRSPATGAPPPA